MPIGAPLVCRLQGLSSHALGEATSQLINRCHRQFWRTWLLGNGFDCPDWIATDEDEFEPLNTEALASWIRVESDPRSEPGQHLHSLIMSCLFLFYQKELQKCLLLGAIGNCWHGIREDVFEFTQRLPNVPKDNERVEQMNDAIEKGATKGLVNGVKRAVQNEQMRDYIEKMGKRYLGQIVNIVTASLEDRCSEPWLDDELIRLAIISSLETYSMKAFPSMGRGFADLFRGFMKDLLCNVVEGYFPRGSAPSLESLENSSAFTVGECSIGLLEERSRKVTKGYFEIVEAMSLLIASNILTNISVLAAGKSHRPTDLLNETIAVTREEIMGLEHKRTPLWRYSLQQAAFRCEQAHNCLTAWGMIQTGRTHVDQDRWEENCIYLGLKGFGQPVDWLV
ncbi:hypothetical protein BCR34DRAFT_606036 [Clohesyomyces aquaticus]|uniref:Uncharacterized protein n=1 Tax=Clohesyomyces aquaticus TaxID=1231657 RepID=A0A1Y1YTZ2_9PLEO|nr:hypothetical protein BCR34DRAFT_606036 [Clohesyomyces aquaticus]